MPVTRPDIAIILQAPGSPELLETVGNVCRTLGKSAEFLTNDPMPPMPPCITVREVQMPDDRPGSVVSAMQQAAAENILVIDPRDGCADAAFPALVQALQSGSDVIIALRDPEERTRLLLPWLLGKILFPDIPDPLSGTFAVKKDLIAGAPLDSGAGVPLLEVLGRCRWHTIGSVPCTGRSGSTYISFTLVLLQAVHLLRHAVQARDNPLWEEERRVAKFLSVGISGIVVNMGVLYGLTEFFGIFYGVSSVIAIELSIVNNFLLNDFWTFHGRRCLRFTDRRHRFFSFQLVTMGGMVVNLAILLILTEWAGTYYLTANLVGILLAFAWNYLVNRNITWR